MHAPDALLLGLDLAVRIEWEDVWPPDPVGTYGGKKIFFPYPGLNHSS